MGFWLNILYGFVVLVASTIFFIWWLYKMLVVDLDHPRIVKMRDTKGVARHYFCAIIQALHMKRGVFYPLPGDKVIKVDENAEINKSKKYKVLEMLEPHPSERLSVVDCYMLHRHLQLFRESINFKGHHTEVPSCFMFAYFNKPLLAVGASKFARARCLGGVHTKQEMTVHQDLRSLLTGRFSLSIQGTEYRKTTRGMEGHVREQVYDEHNILVWEGRSFGLALNDTYKPNKTPAPAQDDFQVYKEEEIVSHMDTGYKFAKAVIDWQPQHLSWWLARLVGFKKPIAHGMWVGNVAVETVIRNESCFHQTYPLHIELVFRSPMELGTTALMRYDEPKGSNSMTRIRVIEPKTKRPILDGRMYVGPGETKPVDLRKF